MTSAMVKKLPATIAGGGGGGGVVASVSGAKGIAITGTATDPVVEMRGDYTTLASAAGVVTVDLSVNQDTFFLQLTENVTSWVFNNLPVAGSYRDIFIVIVQDATPRSVVSPATLTAGSAWVVSVIPSSYEVLGMRVFDDGTKVLFPSGVLV